MLKLTSEQRAKIGNFLFSLTPFTRSEYEKSYPSWRRGGRGWGCLQQGGTGQMLALMWYQHRHKPQSNEWRPAIIIKALLEQSAT